MTSNDISTPKKAESAPRQALELLADWIEASRERDAAEAAIRSGRTGCSDFVKAVSRELDAREALMQLDPAALRARVDIEADGMRAGLGGHAGTHNPYIWKGSPEHRDAWSRGQQAVEKFGRDRYQMGYEKAQEVAGVEGSGTLRAQAEADKGLRGAVTQLMSDPWSYHHEGRRCIDCSALRSEDHFDGCAVVKIRAALAQAGGES